MGVLCFGNFITPKGLVNLKNYKYKSGVYTPLDNFMQPFWNWFVTLIPMVNYIRFLLLVDGSKFSNFCGLTVLTILLYYVSSI